jgi:uroporphyrinogen-III synthase
VGKSWQALSPHPLAIGVMGGSSQHTLCKHGIGLETPPTPIVIPDQPGQWDSEGLWKKLQDLHWDWSQRRVIIFKGEGGRDWLADTLQQAGALVEPISVYSRAPLDHANPIWLTVDALDFAKSLWLLTSSEAVRYLGKVMQARFPGRLQAASAICTHHNIAGAAEQIGFGTVLICEPGDAAVTEATMAWLSSSVD